MTTIVLSKIHLETLGLEIRRKFNGDIVIESNVTDRTTTAGNTVSIVNTMKALYPELSDDVISETARKAVRNLNVLRFVKAVQNTPDQLINKAVSQPDDDSPHNGAHAK